MAQKIVLSLLKKIFEKRVAEATAFTQMLIVVTKWYDNKCVQMVSNFSKPEAPGTAKRWDCKQKAFIEVDCPSVLLI